MELVFRYAAIIALLGRLGAALYCRRATLAASRTRFMRPDLLLLSNLWVTIALTFWVTSLLIDHDQILS